MRRWASLQDCATMLDAAYEIERLRDVLRKISQMRNDEPDCADYARQAIEGHPVGTDATDGRIGT